MYFPIIFIKIGGLRKAGQRSALQFIHYNFARIHKTLRTTPAMAAGLSDHICSYEEIAGLAG